MTIALKEVIRDEIGVPRNDGTRGSGLYAVSFRLSEAPSGEWVELLIRNWNHPPRFTTMHRPGIASVRGDRVILDGTTIDEVEKYHIDTLRMVIEKTNADYSELLSRRNALEEQERAEREAHRRHVEEVASRMNFKE